MATVRLQFRFVIYHDQESEMWIAHSLEMDIVGEGDTPQQALAEVLRLCAIQLQFQSDEDVEDGLAAAIRPAPPEYWVMFAKGRDLAPLISLPSDIFVDGYVARELELCAD